MPASTLVRMPPREWGDLATFGGHFYRNRKNYLDLAQFGGETELMHHGDRFPNYGAFFPDGSRFVFEANAPGHGARLYVQALSGGAPAPISAEGINYSRLFVSPDARWIAALGPDRRIHLYPSMGGSPTDLPASEVGDFPAGWTADGRGLYVSLAGLPCRTGAGAVPGGDPRRA